MDGILLLWFSIHKMFYGLLFSKKQLDSSIAVNFYYKKS